MKIYLIIAFVCTSAFASQDIKDTIASNKQSMQAIQTALGVAQQAIIAACVTPTADLTCNSSTATIVTAIGGITGTLVSGLGGTAVEGTVLSAAIGAVGCQLIKCDTTQTRNQQCNGFQNSASLCPSSGGATQDVAKSCNAGKTVLADQKYLNSVCPTKEGYDECICGDAVGQCSFDVQTCAMCQQTDDQNFDNTFDCSGTDYQTCIDPYKTDAQTRQTKCRTKCDEMVALLAAFNLALTGVNTELKNLANKTTDTGNGNNDNGNYGNGNDSNNNNGNNNNNYNTGSTSSPSLLGSFIGMDQSKTASSTTGSSGSTLPSGGAAGSSSTGKGLAGSAGGASGAEGGQEGSSLGDMGGAGGTASSGQISAAGQGSQLRGITKDSINKKELLPKDADLFATVQKIHNNLYEKKVIGKDVVSKFSNKNNSKKNVGR